MGYVGLIACWCGGRPSAHAQSRVLLMIVGQVSTKLHESQCLEAWKGPTYLFSLQMMSTDDPGETVTRSELTALVEAAVARALSSSP